MVKIRKKIRSEGKGMPKKREARGPDIMAIFESKVFEKLGGSIAFAMKNGRFLWSGHEDFQ